MQVTESESFSVTLPRHIWEGVLFHLEETKDYIPISMLEPDPYECICLAINAIGKFFPDEC